MGQLFLHCVNQYKMETPAQKRKVLSQEEIKLYKVQSDQRDHKVGHLELHDNKNFYRLLIRNGYAFVMSPHFVIL